LPKFEGRSTEKTWLTAILKNTIFVTYRRQKAHRSVFAVTAGELGSDNVFYEHSRAMLLKPVFEYHDENPVQISSEVIFEAINSLPDSWRRVFILKYIDEKPVTEICAALNITLSNCYIICHRARQNLKAYLDKQRCLAEKI